MIELLKQKLNDTGEINFKLYSLIYVIKKVENKVVIYPKLYEYKKTYYNDIDTLLDNYLIFNENIRDNEEKIRLDKIAKHNARI